jgi:hypothetical protein
MTLEYIICRVEISLKNSIGKIKKASTDHFLMIIFGVSI